MRKIYIAGPMTGVRAFNVDAFMAAAKKLKAEGWEVVNPAEIALNYCGKEGINIEDLAADPIKMDAVMEKEHQFLSDCDAIYLLQGWEDSEGAKSELEWALVCELKIIIEKSATDTEP